MVATHEIRGILREPERLAGLRHLMAAGGGEGMQTLDQHVSRLLESGVIASETAAALGA